MKKVLANFTDWPSHPDRRKLNTYGGIGYYRMWKPSRQLTDFEVDFRGADIDQYGDTFEENWNNIFKQYDIVWSIHFFNTKLQLAQCYYAQLHKKLLIYDLDDNYLDLPESNPVYKDFFHKEGDMTGPSNNQASLTAALSLADALTVSTEPLKERMTAHFKRNFGIEKPIYVIPNMNDLADFNYPMPPRNDTKIVIGYQGSESHVPDLQMVLPTIKKLMRKHKNVHFEILGVVAKENVKRVFGAFEKDLFDRMAMVPVTSTFIQYPEWLAAQRWDIGIAPLVDNSFNKSKSHIKWMEYAAYKIPCVASRVYPYSMPLQGRNTIVDGETGLLCRTPDWEKALERLIVDANFRHKIGQQAYDAVKKDWQYKDSQIQSTFKQMVKDLSGIKKAQKSLI